MNKQMIFINEFRFSKDVQYYKQGDKPKEISNNTSARIKIYYITLCL